jgi:pimeloyl-ACP methyl ester carboxylesterase
MTPTVTRRYVDGVYGQVHLRQAGAMGPKSALLCLHMSPMSGRIFERLLAEMGRDRFAVAPDTPGFGMSDPPSSPPEIADYAMAMSEVIDSLGLDGPVDVLGYHTGSMIAPELAILRPDRIRRVVMVAAPIYTAEERETARRQYKRPEPRADGRHLLDPWIGLTHWNLHSGATLGDVADEFPEMIAGRSLAGWGHRAAFNHRLDERLPLVRQPVLVLNPQDDIWDKTPRAAACLHDGRIVDLPGWGHGFQTRRAADAASLLRSFLDAPDAAPFGALQVPEDALVERVLPKQANRPASPE